ncbi:MAG: E3 ubiquitin protein ligase [Candidatus Heimdallarchaeota archaeon]|nr:E3 ubiquitin protein ligase [Candidatus Heimdallarchaeota archaeon]
MDPWLVFLIIFVFVVIVIVIASLRRKGQKKEPRRAVHTYLEHGDYVSAGRMHLQQKKEEEAASLYFQIPPDKKPLYESMILQQLGAQSAQLFWIKTGRRLERSSPEHAKIAYLLAGAHFDAVKMFIDRNNPTDAIEIVKHIQVSHQESTVRRLSQYAFNRGKYTIAADLLRAIGLVDEGDAILAVAAHEFGAIERPEMAATMYDSVGRQDLVGESQEHRGEQALSQGKIEEAKVAFEEAVKAYDESNQPKDALRVEDRLKKFNLLDKFRDYAANGNAEAAEDMIDEISASFPAIAMSDLYAEIAAVLERSGRPSDSVTYYDKAADSTNNPLKRQGYVNALRRVGSQIASQRGAGETVATSNLKDNCIVCKRPISKNERIVSCPHCSKTAHYSHFIEWVKVQGSCPNCNNRLKADDFK